VKGGKIISAGYNHHRPHYDGAETGTRGHRKPVSMHAEMHAIFNLTGMSPSFKKQVQGIERRVPQRTNCPPPPTAPATWKVPIPKGSAASERRLSGANDNEGCSEIEGAAQQVSEEDGWRQSTSECCIERCERWEYGFQWERKQQHRGYPGSVFL